nr:hypothetical protein BaRGS_008841 [Batillaria attramentaria]
MTAADDQLLDSHLEVVYTSPKEGYIQTQGWDESVSYPENLNAWTRIDVPVGNSILLTVVQLDLGPFWLDNPDTLTLLQGENSTNNTVWQAKGDRLPPLLPNGKWNCSQAAGNFSEFQQHFPCNLQNDCVGGEDESACPYKTPDCCPQYLIDRLQKVQNNAARLVLKAHYCNSLLSGCPQYLIDRLQKVQNNAARLVLKAHYCNSLLSGCPQYLIDRLQKVQNNAARLVLKAHYCNSLLSGCPQYLIDRLQKVQNNAARLSRGGRLAVLDTQNKFDSVAKLMEVTKFGRIYVGLSSVPPSYPEMLVSIQMYRNMFQWSDGVVAYYVTVIGPSSKPDCLYLYWRASRGRYFLRTDNCHDEGESHFLCEILPDATDPLRTESHAHAPQIGLNSTTSAWTTGSERVQCPSGHLTHQFLACDVKASCWERGAGGGGEGGGEGGGGAGAASSEVSCLAPLTPLPPSFTCADEVEHVPYTLVCDHRADCRDASDEDFCIFPPCQLIGQYECGNQQCVPREQRCDGVRQCINGADEKECVQSTELNASCPEQYFLCPSSGYCLPVYVRCNGVCDCPGKEDEAACDSYTCPGYYRCRRSRICVHTDHMCDGISQCPERDDELLCHLTCPESCTCYGLAFFCAFPFHADDYSGNLRLLDARGSGMTPSDVANNTMLIHLSLADCGLTRLEGLVLPNLRSLDLSDNLLVEFSGILLKGLPNIRSLSLAGNPLTSFFSSSWSVNVVLPPVHAVDLSRVIIPELNVSDFAVLPQLKTLNLTGSRTELVKGGGFRVLTHLRAVDVRGCPMTEFPRSVFQGLDKLDEVHADNYKLCCEATLPKGFNTLNCKAPADEVSSCDSLFKSKVFRVFLSIFVTLTLLGNTFSVVYRSFMNRLKSVQVTDVFVTHLCFSDFLMGVYLAVIGMADLLSQGNYVWEDLSWRQSTTCKTAGFLAVVSNQVSIFVVCLMTVDRFIVLKLPSCSLLQFGRLSAHVACAVAWACGLLLAVVPLLPVSSRWHFFDQNGVCFPLPTTIFAGRSYFLFLTYLNFAFSLLILAGQVIIYRAVRTTSLPLGDASQKAEDLSLARRLLTVVTSNALAWIFIGLVCSLALCDASLLPGELPVATVVVVMPLNAAINPALYFLGISMEKSRQEQEKRLQQVFLSQMKQTKSTNASAAVVKPKKRLFTEQEAWQLFRMWLVKGLLSRDEVTCQLKAVEEKQ